MEELTIIKIGGKVIEKRIALNDFLDIFCQIKGKKILVHGGGVIATKIAQQLGVKTQMVNGRRVTDKNMLDVAIMVYGGLINKNIVTKLQALNCNALGFTGADLNIIQSIKRSVKDIDYGFVGDIKKVNTPILKNLINENVVPVIAPLTHDKKGSILNTNADTIASELAKALSNNFNVNLIYCFEKEGVLYDEKDDSSIIKELTFTGFKKYQKEGIITNGMVPKLDNAFDSLKKGVKTVRIIKPTHLKHIKEGTLLKL